MNTKSETLPPFPRAQAAVCRVINALQHHLPDCWECGLKEKELPYRPAQPDPALCPTCGEPLTLDCGPTGDQSSMICQPCLEAEAALAFVKRFTKHVSGIEGNGFEAQDYFDMLIRAKGQDGEQIEAMFNQVKALSSACRKSYSMLSMLPCAEFWNAADAADFFNGDHGKMMRAKFDEAWAELKAVRANA